MVRDSLDLRPALVKKVVGLVAGPALDRISQFVAARVVADKNAEAVTWIVQIRSGTHRVPKLLCQSNKLVISTNQDSGNSHDFFRRLTTRTDQHVHRW